MGAAEQPDKVASDTRRTPRAVWLRLECGEGIINV